MAALQFQQSSYPPAQGAPQEDGPPSEEDSPLFATDDFRIWCMKVIPCTKRFVHDWTICPFAHAGEKAVRRDPRTHNYTGIACPDMKKQSSCIRGDKCPYAHNVFEYWLHPTRYRTQLCNDGPLCKRSICFFAHSLEELRVPAVKPYVSPEALARASLEAIQQNPHPLGQQLPNPAAAMRASSGGLPPAQQSGTPRAMPYSAPAGVPRGGHAGPFGPPPPMHFPQQQPLAAQPQQRGMQPPPQLAGFPGPYGQPQQQPFGRAPVRGSADFGGTRRSIEGMALSLTPAAPHWGAEALGFPTSPAPAPGWAPEFPGSLPSSANAFAGFNASGSSGGSGSGTRTAPSSCRPSFDTSTYAAAAPAPCLSNSSLAAGMGRLASSAENLAVLEAVRPSYESEGSDRAGTPGSDGAGSGGLGPGADLDLAQSLATLKIALTQQHVAAASGSNHEIVISTLHQILKDAIAQHGGKLPNLVLPGQPGSPGEPSAAAGAGVPNPALAASSGLYAASGAASSAAGAVPTSAPAQPTAASQQPWISTMGNIKWDSSPSATSPNSTAGGAGGQRLSGDTAGGAFE